MKNEIKFKLKFDEYQIQNFPFHNYKIIQISDLHLGFGTPPDILEHIVNTTIKLSPDLVVITGDLMEGDITDLREQLQVLRRLTKEIDTYFVFGNHDCQFNRVEKVTELLTSLGVQILVNESVLIGEDHQKFNLTGVTDQVAIRYSYNYPDRYRPNIDKALKNVDRRYPTILLSHRSICRYMHKDYGVDLCISGHIHGGQIFPVGLLILLIKEDSGEKLCVFGKKFGKYRYMHVSKGLGYTKLPFRLFARSELNLIALNPA